MSRKTVTFLILASVFLTACGGVIESFEPAATSLSPPAAEINAAAERAATAAHAAVAELQEAPSDDPQPAQSTEPAIEQPEAEQQTADLPELNQPTTNRRVDVGEIGRFPQLLPFDGIRPVYDPVFAAASNAPLDDNELIIGIALDGEAKAYPISVLRFREMVNDELAGIPTLVTW